MNRITYKIFVVHTSEGRVNEILNSFEDIKNRIINETKGKLFTRFVVELDDEELAIIKLSIDPSESLITIGAAMDMNTAVFDAHVEIGSYLANSSL